jgi:hypothetical protein
LRGHGDDDEEAEKQRSDTARLRASRRFTKYGIRPPPGFKK